MHVTFHKVAEAEVEAASKGATADEIADMTGQPENARLVNLLKGGALSVTIKKGAAKQQAGGVQNPNQPDLANQVSPSKVKTSARKMSLPNVAMIVDTTAHKQLNPPCQDSGMAGC